MALDVFLHLILEQGLFQNKILSSVEQSSIFAQGVIIVLGFLCILGIPLMFIGSRLGRKLSALVYIFFDLDISALLSAQLVFFFQQISAFFWEML